MKKTTNEFKNKSEKELSKQIEALRREITKEVIESKISPSKDTNSLTKKRKKLAVVMTVLRMKELSN